MIFSFSKKEDSGTDEKSRKLRLILILAGAAAGILLLLLGSGTFLPSQKEIAAATPEITPQEELEAYQTYLENRVRTLCESVRGVGKATVTVTLCGGFETVYAKETVNGNEQYVIIGSGSSAGALCLSRTAPEIAGIGIVCTGGGNDSVRQELTFLLTATFHVPSNRVYIAEAK